VKLEDCDRMRLFRLSEEAEVVMIILVVPVDWVDSLMIWYFHIFMQNGEVMVVDEDGTSGEHCKMNISDWINGFNTT